MKTNGCIHQDSDFSLRLAVPEDAGRISDYFLQNREHLKPWDPKREEAFYTLQGWRQKLIKLNELHQHDLAFYCVIVDSEGVMLGTISFSNLTQFPFHACNVGYSLAQSAQGRGIMRRALKAACQWMFSEKGLHRIMAAYIPRNVRSANVLESLGFEKEGLAKQYLLIDGQWQDHVLTSLINQQWKAQ